MCLFVTFEKKAGMIRLSDSAVGEVEILGDIYKERRVSGLAQTIPLSYDLSRDSKESKAFWLLPLEVQLPASEGRASQSLYFITRGLQTHAYPSPLPFSLIDYPPLITLFWTYPLRSMCCRLHYHPDADPILQVVGFGEYGVEVQELRLDVFYKGKQKEEHLRAYVDVGETGYLCRGGLWHNPLQSIFAIGDDVSDTNSSVENGIYAWCREDLEDWRIIWIGG